MSTARIRRRIARAGAAVALVVAATAGSLAGATGAVAAPGGLEYSSDGIAWSTTAPTALFPSGYDLVPGDSRTAVLYVRSAHATPARFTAMIGDPVWSDAAAASIFHVKGEDQTAAGLSRRAIGSIEDCTAVVPTRVLQPGAEVRIAVTVSIPATVTDVVGQGTTAGFVLELGLADLQVARTAGGCPVPDAEIGTTPGDGSNPAGGELGATGVELLPQTLAVSLAAGILGLVLMLVARRRSRREDALDTQDAAPERERLGS